MRPRQGGTHARFHPGFLVHARKRPLRVCFCSSVPALWARRPEAQLGSTAAAPAAPAAASDVPARRRAPSLPPSARCSFPLPTGGATVRYIDGTEAEAQRTCCVNIEDFWAPGDKGHAAVMLHFGRYADAWAALGRRLTIDVQRHPSMQAWMDGMAARAAGMRR